MKEYSYYAIIVAGGSGKRMNSVIPKQFININGKPILMHTIEKFHQSSYNPKIILVLSESDMQFWNDKVHEYNFNIPYKVISGGKERFFSVKNGLAEITDKNSIIAIHDAVRPLVSIKTIDNCYASALNNGNAVAAIGSKDSVRIINNNNNQAIDRNKVVLVQTPQTFNYEQLNTAYLQKYSSDFTDDASVVEKAGYNICLEDGDLFNIKITFEEDLDLAEILLTKKAK